MSYYFWLGRDGEMPRYTYHGNWDFGDPVCRANPGKFLPIDNKTREDCMARFDTGVFRGFPKVA